MFQDITNTSRNGLQARNRRSFGAVLMGSHSSSVIIAQPYHHLEIATLSFAKASAGPNAHQAPFQSQMAHFTSSTVKNHS